MKTLNDVKSLLEGQMALLRQRYRVTGIGLFGSYVRGEQQKDSDVDVLVDYEALPSLLKIVNMENYLSDLLEEKVDLIPRECIRPELKEAILSEVVML
ncbi:MAG: nucleotidyltransferase family protein [Chitinispirillaceae bacterium]|nr:nucleotidyltransferase family protein [Chitinispirillaceae bacterium]